MIISVIEKVGILI